ncbi:YdcF family protein [Bacillus sp. AK031]
MMRTNPLSISALFLAVILCFFVLFFGVTFGIMFIAANFLACIFLYLSYQSLKKGNKVMKVIHRAALTIYALFLLSFAAVQLMLLAEINNADPSGNAGHAIILGAGLKGEEISRTLESRLEAGLKFLQDNPDVPVIVSGGQGEGEDIPESTAMSRYLVSHGISNNRITEESKSTTTWENLHNSKKILLNKGTGLEGVVIITSDYHLFRARQIGEKLGFESTGVAADSDFFIKVNYMIREYFAVLKMMVFGGREGA